MSSQSETPANNNIKKFVVRLPESLRDNISVAAKQFHRSMNSEIVSRLGTSFKYNPLLSNTEPLYAYQAPTNVNIVAGSNLDTLLAERIKTLPESKKLALLKLLDNENRTKSVNVG